MASTPQAFAQSAQKLVLKRGDASRREAYQTLVNHVTIDDGSVPAHDQLTFFYPRYARTVIWRPLSASSRPLTVLYADSYAAILTED